MEKIVDEKDFVLYGSKEGVEKFLEACVKITLKDEPEKERGGRPRLIFLGDELSSMTKKDIKVMATIVGEYMAVNFKTRKQECELMIDKYLVANPDIKPDDNGEYEWDITARKLKK